MYAVSIASCDLVNVCCVSQWSIVVCRDKKQQCSEFAFAQLAQNFLHEASGKGPSLVGQMGMYFASCVQ